jgi:perosamine synthetase
VREIADRHGVPLVEDACQAPGAVIEGRLAGTWGDAAALSFGGSKLLTAGRGGAVLTARADVHQRIKVFCDRGNHAFPLSELQAAVLLPQLARLDERNARRLAAARRLTARLQGVPGLLPLVNATAATPAYYKLGFQCRAEELGGWPRDELVACVQAEGIALDAGFRGFAGRGPRRCRQAGELSHSRAAAAGTVLLHHPVLLADDGTLDRVADGLAKVARALLAAPPDAA